MLINTPPGCFGKGPGSLKKKAGTLRFNSSSFIAYANVFEVRLVLSKMSIYDGREVTRKSSAKIDIELLSVAVPIVAIECASTCYPSLTGVFVNPTSRLALRGACTDKCQDGKESYEWLFADDQKMETCFLDPTMRYMGTERPLLQPTTSTTTTTTHTTPAVVKQIRVQQFRTADTHYVAAGSMLDFVNGISMAYPANGGDGLAKRRRRRRWTAPNRSKRQAASSAANTWPCTDAYCMGRFPSALSGCGPGHRYVFAGGEKDYRNQKDLSMVSDFFAANPDVLEFTLRLNVTQTVFNGRKNVSASGLSTLKILVNRPPENGTCYIQRRVLKADGSYEWENAETGLAMLDEFKLWCKDWVDPNGHTIVKYSFTIVQLDNNNRTMPLYSGPLPEATAVLPMGQFHLYAKITESAGAYATFDINLRFPTVMPSERQYYDYNILQKVQDHQRTGNQQRIAQILTAQASIVRVACYFNMTCKYDGWDGVEDANQGEVEIFKQLVRNISNANSEALKAGNTLNFNNIDQLVTGSSLLSAVAENSAAETETTIDMVGRDEAVKMFTQMSDGFKGLNTETEYPDTEDLNQFVKNLLSSTVSIAESINDVLYYNDPDAIPLTDFERAADMPYDTDIGEGDMANVAESDEAAFRLNVLTNTRNAAIKQINTMVNLIDDISKTMVLNSVSGEENKVSTPLGAEMIVSKKSGDKCMGDDIDGDGVPDLPLRYEFPNADTDSMNVVQFPLGFCPGRPDTNFVLNDTTGKCPGSWGIVVKEWKIFMASYPPTAKNLNPTTKQLDVDVYDDQGNLVKIENMPLHAPIELTIMRQKDKAPREVTFSKNQTYRVFPEMKLKQLERRKRAPIIYHNFTVDKPMASLTVQLRMDEYFHRDNTTMAFMLRYKKLPTLQSCEVVKLVGSMEEMDEKYLSQFFTAEFVANRTGAWFLGMMAFDGSVPTDLIDGENCSVNQIDAGKLNKKSFLTDHYTTRIYASGCYFFNKTTDMWEASGISVVNSSKIVTSCHTNHLSQYGSGFIQEVNTIDFEFVFAEASFEDNMTIYMCLIITFAVYFLCMIYAVIKDNRDVKRLAVPFLRDNHPEDMYMYEVIVETGPLAQHATTSQIYFVLTGEDEDTGVRCFTDPSRKLFKAGGIDSFLLTTQVPLGELKMLRLWNDNSGLRDMGAWYVLGVTVKDVQTGVMDKFIFDEWVACDRDNYQESNKYA